MIKIITITETTTREYIITEDGKELLNKMYKSSQKNTDYSSSLEDKELEECRNLDQLNRAELVKERKLLQEQIDRVELLKKASEYNKQEGVEVEVDKKTKVNKTKKTK